MVQIVPREKDGIMRASSCALWQALSTVGLDEPVNLRFTTFVERGVKLCTWTTQGVHKIFDVIVDDKVYCEAG